jgi:Ydr279p protein family (RNase H2 complex component) wHTH domain
MAWLLQCRHLGAANICDINGMCFIQLSAFRRSFIAYLCDIYLKAILCCALRLGAKSYIKTCVHFIVFTLVCTDQLGPNTLLYKLNEDKTLAWLQSKLQRVLSALIELDTTAIKNGTKGSQAGMVSGFNAPHINDTAAAVVAQPLTTAVAAADNSSDVSSKQHSNEHIEKALELVCEYLTPEWSHKLANTHKFESTSLFEARGTKRKAIVPVWESTKQEDRDLSLSIGGVNKSNGNSSDSKRKATVNRTTSKLAKVNTKGMKSIASMFGSKPKSK